MTPAVMNDVVVITGPQRCMSSGTLITMPANVPHPIGTAMAPVTAKARAQRATVARSRRPFSEALPPAFISPTPISQSPWVHRCQNW